MPPSAAEMRLAKARPSGIRSKPSFRRWRIVKEYISLSVGSSETQFQRSSIEVTGLVSRSTWRQRLHGSAERGNTTCE